MVNDGDSHWDKSSLSGELGWGITLLVMAGGALLGLVRTREHVCRLCLEAGRRSFGISLPICFLTGLEFSRYKRAFCKESVDSVLGVGHAHPLLRNKTSCLSGKDRLVVVLCGPGFSLYNQIQRVLG